MRAWRLSRLGTETTIRPWLPSASTAPRSAQLGVVEMLEHVPEDDDVGTFGRRVERLDRRIAGPPAPRRPVPAYGSIPTTLRSSSASRRMSRPSPDPISITRAPGATGPSARRTATCPRPPQRLEQQVDDNGRWA